MKILAFASLAKLLPVLLLGPAVIAVIIILILCLKRPSSQKTEAPDEVQIPEKETVTQEKEVELPEQEAVTSEEEVEIPEENAGVIAQGLRRTASNYDGLYEGIYQAVKNPDSLCADAYQEWCDRAALSPDPAFREAFASLFQKADIKDAPVCLEKHRQLLVLINRAGILRDRDTGIHCTADESICKYYYEITGQKPKNGASYQIIKSAWIMDGKVIEYGMVMASGS